MTKPRYGHFRFLLSVVIASIAFTGCGGTPASSPAPTTAPPTPIPAASLTPAPRPTLPGDKMMWAGTTCILIAKAREAQRSFSNQVLRVMWSHGKTSTLKWQSSYASAAMIARVSPTAITVPRHGTLK